MYFTLFGRLAWVGAQHTTYLFPLVFFLFSLDSLGIVVNIKCVRLG